MPGLWRCAHASPAALETLNRIGALYGIEKDIRGKPPDDRQAQRQARAGPLLADLEQWLVEVTATLSAKSDLAVVIGYATSRWPVLRYRDDGNLEIDNNSSERSLRVVALTRRNLFILRLGYGRTSRCGDLQLDRHRQAQQRQSRMSSAGGALVPVSVPEQRFPYGYEGKAFIEIKRASN